MHLAADEGPVLNSGSLDQWNLYEMDTEDALAGGVLERVGSPESLHRWQVRGQKGEALTPASDHKAGVAAILAQIAGPGGIVAEPAEVRAVGHRVVHGGESLVKPTVIDDKVKETIRACAQFAPIHNPANLAGIDAAQAVLPDAKHVAIFDTAFHGEMPPHAYMYALPQELT